MCLREWGWGIPTQLALASGCIFVEFQHATTSPVLKHPVLLENVQRDACANVLATTGFCT